MLTAADLALTQFEQRRAAANDDRMKPISAMLKVNTAQGKCTLPAIGANVQALSKMAGDLAGDKPFGCSVMVRQ
jgi:hypothetical protein